jgi:uncharacterized protein (TIGR02646 family)
MRAITKDLSHNGYKPLRGKVPPLSAEQATRAWEKFGSKSSVQNALLAEQYHLCCYSEIRADEESLGYHIEHVENKSQHPQRTFDATNLAASAIDSNHGFEKLKAEPGGLSMQLFGGHAPGKSNGCDAILFVSCHQTDCRRFFSFLSDGRIKPADTLTVDDVVKADYTIALLNLNSPYLITRRRQWWKELQGKDADLDNDVSALERLAEADLLPVDGQLNRFFSLTRQFYGPVAEEILNQNAPHLV